MNCSIWDKTKGKYKEINNVKHICTDLTGKYTFFEIDGKRYSTDKYDLDFIHSG